MRQPVYYYRRRRFRPLHFVALAVIVAALAAAGFSWWFLHRGGGGGVGFLRPARRLPPRPPAEWATFERDPGPPGALLVIHGAHEFAGRAEMICSPLPPHGLQISLRTGSPELPVVVFRFASFPPAPGGAGGAAELLVTGRNGPALAGSRGNAELAVYRPDPPPVPPAANDLAGILRGTFQGAGGRGEIEARLRGCATAVTPLPPWGEPRHLGAHAADTDGEQ